MRVKPFCCFINGARAPSTAAGEGKMAKYFPTVPKMGARAAHVMYEYSRTSGIFGGGLAGSMSDAPY